MTDKEILQGIDKLEDGIPFDEIRNGDKWLDIHELLSEVRERIKEWHYPSKGELPTESGKYFCVHKYNQNLIPTVGIYNANHKLWCGESGIAWNRDPFAWQYIILPKEEA